MPFGDCKGCLLCDGQSNRTANVSRVKTSGRFAEPIIHLDMDAFFVEVERLRNPELRGVPVAVGGAGARGVVASASYEARAFGVTSAMPMGRARRKCPTLVVVPPEHIEYRRLSGLVFELLRRFTPDVEAVSIDEAFLDIGGMRRHYLDPMEAAISIRETIRSELDLPSSAGVASNKLIAKLASQDAKPDGIRWVPAAAVADFLNPLPVRRLWGVGEATHVQLEQLGVKTIGDLAGIPVGTLERRVGATLGRHLHHLARGIDDRPVLTARDSKSISVENTFDQDLEDHAQIEREVLRQADVVSERIRGVGLKARTVTLKIRFGDFTTITRSQTSDWPISVGRDIYQVAARLLCRADIGDRKVRLIGLGLSLFEDEDAPRQLATDRPATWDDLADAVSEVRDRFGMDSVKPARLTRVESDDYPQP